MGHGDGHLDIEGLPRFEATLRGLRVYVSQYLRVVGEIATKLIEKIERTMFGRCQPIVISLLHPRGGSLHAPDNQKLGAKLMLPANSQFV